MKEEEKNIRMNTINDSNFPVCTNKQRPERCLFLRQHVFYRKINTQTTRIPRKSKWQLEVAARHNSFAEHVTIFTRKWKQKCVTVFDCCVQLLWESISPWQWFNTNWHSTHIQSLNNRTWLWFSFLFWCIFNIGVSLSFSSFFTF